tara:strand:+ start:485 stop:1282 length:798 start_codon:yes stop_codon:yes gene_type:complete
VEGSEQEKGKAPAVGDQPKQKPSSQAPSLTLTKPDARQRAQTQGNSKPAWNLDKSDSNQSATVLSTADNHGVRFLRMSKDDQDVPRRGSKGDDGMWPRALSVLPNGRSSEKSGWRSPNLKAKKAAKKKKSSKIAKRKDKEKNSFSSSLPECGELDICSSPESSRVRLGLSDEDDDIFYVDEGIAQFLQSLGLSQYCKTFSTERIDMSILPHITAMELRYIGIPLGDAKRIEVHREEFIQQSKEESGKGKQREDGAKGEQKENTDE